MELAHMIPRSPRKHHEQLSLSCQGGGSLAHDSLWGPGGYTAFHAVTPCEKPLRLS